MFDHEFSQALAVDEDDFVLNALGILDGCLLKIAGGDEDAFWGGSNGHGIIFPSSK